MIPERIHWLEKFQVQMAVVGAAGAVFLYFWRCAQTTDPVGPATFLPTGSTGGLIAVAVIFLVLAAVCGLVTITSRPEGALAAALLGLGGLSLRSPSVELLFQQREGHFDAVYRQMGLELAVLAAIVLAGIGVILAMRWLIARVRPRWLWRDLTEGLAAPAEESGRKKLLASLACVGMSIVIAAVLAHVLMRSSLRGQIVFAVLASSTVAVLIAHQIQPASVGMLIWLAPVAVGVLYYVLGAIWVGGGGWMDVRAQAQALPIDWIAAGGGGATLGYWISARMHEVKLLELEEDAAGA